MLSAHNENKLSICWLTKWGIKAYKTQTCKQIQKCKKRMTDRQTDTCSENFTQICPIPYTWFSSLSLLSTTVSLAKVDVPKPHKCRFPIEIAGLEIGIIDCRHNQKRCSLSFYCKIEKWWSHCAVRSRRGSQWSRWSPAPTIRQTPTTECTTRPPCTVLSIGRRAFASTGLTVRNSLPDNLRDSTVGSDQFQRELKTHLFACLLNTSSTVR